MAGSVSFQLGRTLVVAGVVLVAIGLWVMWGSRWGLLPGRLPGDIAYHGKRGSVYFPIATCLILSAALTLILWLISLLSRR